MLVRKADMAVLEGAVQAALPACAYELCADGTITLGGVRLACGNVLFDETLDDRLASLREGFLGRCGLHVDVYKRQPHRVLTGPCLPLFIIAVLQ